MRLGAGRGGGSGISRQTGSLFTPTRLKRLRGVSLPFRRIWTAKVRRAAPACLACCLVFGVAGGSCAQVLARPGWAGSGVAPESWLRNAVFYRIDPTRFQASGDRGVGDLAGIIQRLDYLQSLGVDALVLDDQRSPLDAAEGRFKGRSQEQCQDPSQDQFQEAVGPVDASGLDDLIREASRRHLRLLLTVTPAMQRGDARSLLETVHGWLTAGAAGVFLPKIEPGNGAADAAHPPLVAALHSLLRSFPGERVLLTDAEAETGSMAVSHTPQRRKTGASSAKGTAQLTTAALLPVEPPSVAALRQSLAALAEGSAAGTPGLLRFAEDPPTGSADAAGVAAILLTLRGPAMFNFGDEIGLRTSLPAQATDGQDAPVMQWTPLNREAAPPAPIERAAPAPAEMPFGAYHPYVNPPPGSLVGGAPAAPRAAVDGNIPAALPDANTLPGFTTGPLPNAPVSGETINVTTEDRDPSSLLNAYRQLIALHHGNVTLRNGALVVLDRNPQDRDAQTQDAHNALVWVRRAPAGARASADVIAAVNLGAQPVTLSLDGSLAGLGLRTGTLRPLFTRSRQPMTGETTAALRLPPHAVFLGEVSRSSGSAAPSHAPRADRRRR